MSRYHEITAEITKLEEERADLAETSLKEEIQQLFDLTPELISFSWANYEEYDDNNFYRTTSIRRPIINYSSGTSERQKTKIKTRLVEILRGFEDYLESLFGDDVEMVVTREGIVVEGYSY